MALEISVTDIMAEIDNSSGPMSPAEVVAEFAKFIGEPYKGSQSRLVLDTNNRFHYLLLLVASDGSETLVEDVLLPDRNWTLGEVLLFIVSRGEEKSHRKG